MGGIWGFLIGMIVGAIIGIFIMALISAAPDPENRSGGFDNDDDEI